MGLRLAVLISGGGRTMQNLAEAIDRGELDAEIHLVVASNAGRAAAGVERAARLKLPNMIVPRKGFADVASFSKHVFDLVQDAGCNFVCLAGWLSLLEIPPAYQQRVLNVHPALLPAFGGEGMWGHHVHEAVLAAGCKVSGCTVHFCDATYDTGPILVQRTCPVHEEDTPDTLAARVFEQECIAYPEALRLIAAGRVSIEGRRTRIAPAPT